MHAADLNKHAEELFTDEVEMIATVLNNSCQFKTPAHMLNKTEAHKTSP